VVCGSLFHFLHHCRIGDFWTFSNNNNKVDLACGVRMCSQLTYILRSRISFGVPVFEQWPLKRYIISLIVVVLSTDARGFILVNQIRIENFCLSSRNNWAYSIDCYCSFVNSRSICRLSVKSMSYLLIARPIVRNIYPWFTVSMF